MKDSLTLCSFRQEHCHCHYRVRWTGELMVVTARRIKMYACKIKPFSNPPFRPQVRKLETGCSRSLHRGCKSPLASELKILGRMWTPRQWTKCRTSQRQSKVEDWTMPLYRVKVLSSLRIRDTLCLPRVLHIVEASSALKFSSTTLLPSATHSALSSSFAYHHTTAFQVQMRFAKWWRVQRISILERHLCQKFQQARTEELRGLLFKSTLWVKAILKPAQMGLCILPCFRQYCSSIVASESRVVCYSRSFQYTTRFARPGRRILPYSK